MGYYIFEDDGTPLELSHVPQGAREVSKAEFKRAQTEHARKQLLALLKPGDTVYCVLKHRSPSGMSRVIDFLIPINGVSESVGGTPPEKLKVGDFVYFWRDGYEGKESWTINGKIVRAPKGSDSVTLRLGADGSEVIKPRAVLTIRNRRAYTSIRSISELMAQANGFTVSKSHNGLQIGGCGMDAGFGAVYGLGCCLWPNGTDKPHGRRNGKPDNAGGYALKHQWL